MNDMRKYDRAVSDYVDDNHDKITVIESAILLAMSQEDNIPRMPEWGDSGVYMFASMMCYERQNTEVIDLFHETFDIVENNMDVVEILCMSGPKIGMEEMNRLKLIIQSTNINHPAGENNANKK